MKRASIDELTSIRDIVLLTMCLEVVDYRHSQAATQEEKWRIERIQIDMINDIAALKKQLKEADIKVLFEIKEDKEVFIEYPFICRGYQDRFQALKDHFRALIKEKIKEYKG